MVKIPIHYRLPMGPRSQIGASTINEIAYEVWEAKRLMGVVEVVTKRLIP